ncbi:MAG: hypothetical protein ACLFSQ_05895 [Candidatus Zixiibacteriota bacterium]
MNKRYLFILSIILILSAYCQVIRNPLTNAGDGDSGDIMIGSIVRVIDDNIVIPCNEGERPSGAILLTQPVRNAPDQYQITTSGLINWALYAGDISAGDLLIPADGGAVKAYYPGAGKQYIIGTAVESGAAGEKHKILVNIDNTNNDSTELTTPILDGLFGAHAEGTFQDIDIGDSWTDIESVEIIVSSDQDDSTIVIINASATITTDCTRWSGFPNDQWGFAYIRVMRDGQYLCGSSNAVVGQYAYVYPTGSKFFGGAAALSINAFDNPEPGKHTYTLQYENSALDIVDHVPFGLTVMEIKR